MIFDGLLSRSRLRSRLAERSELEVGLPSQVRHSTYLRVCVCTNQLTMGSVHSQYLILRRHIPLKESDRREWLKCTVLFPS